MKGIQKEVLYKKAFLRKTQENTAGNYPCRSFFISGLTDSRPATLLKRGCVAGVFL